MHVHHFHMYYPSLWGWRHYKPRSNCYACFAIQKCCTLCISVAATQCILVSQAIPFAETEEGSGHAASDRLLARNAIILQHNIFVTCLLLHDSRCNLIGHDKIRLWCQLGSCSGTISFYVLWRVWLVRLYTYSFLNLGMQWQRGRPGAPSPLSLVTLVCLLPSTKDWWTIFLPSLPLVTRCSMLWGTYPNNSIPLSIMDLTMTLPETVLISLVPRPPPQLSSLAVRITYYSYCKRR